MRRWESDPAPTQAATRCLWSIATCSATWSSSTQVREGLPFTFFILLPLQSEIITSVNPSMTLKLQFVPFQRRGTTFVTSVAKPLNRGSTCRFTRWDIQGPNHCSKFWFSSVHFIRDHYYLIMFIIDYFFKFQIAQKRPFSLIFPGVISTSLLNKHCNSKCT